MFIITGPAEDVLEAFRGPQQADEHCKGWRWELYMQNAKRADAAVREFAKQHIKAVNDAREAASSSYMQAAE